MLMGLFDMVLIGIGLAMDAAAVAAVNGMAMVGFKWGQALATALTFGLFQGFMPLIGYFVGTAFSTSFAGLAHLIACLLLGLVGTNMIRESRNPAKAKSSLTFTGKCLLLQALATSIDALAIGVSLAVVNAPIFLAATVIALTTALLAFNAAWLGQCFGNFLADKAQLAGGLILILMGLKTWVF